MHISWSTQPSHMGSLPSFHFFAHTVILSYFVTLLNSYMVMHHQWHSVCSSRNFHHSVIHLEFWLYLIFSYTFAPFNGQFPTFWQLPLNGWMDLNLLLSVFYTSRWKKAIITAEFSELRKMRKDVPSNQNGICLMSHLHHGLSFCHGMQFHQYPETFTTTQT